MRFGYVSAVFLMLLSLASPALAAKGDICRTPDGFVFAANNGMGGTGIDRNGMGGTGINGNGMGGTGMKFSERKGIGGTGINGGGDIGVYGRITGFGSICVNGMEIEYKKSTPVSDAGGMSTAKDLKVGQIVAVRAYGSKDGFHARRISIEKIVSGRVSHLDAKHGTLTVLKEKVVANDKSRDALKGIRDGDIVAVSGLRRADGTIVAGHIEKASKAKAAHAKDAAALFGPGVKFFSVQGYVQSNIDGQVKLADGTVILMPASMKSQPQENQRVIIFGDVDHDGNFVADSFVPEVISFPSTFNLPLLKDGQGLLDKNGQLLLDKNGLPVLGGKGIEVPNGGGLPNLPNVPNVPNVPTLPNIPNIPNIPAPPPIDIPVIPPPPVVPDLPILPGG